MLKVFCDGGSRGNPGPAAYGFVVKKNDKTIIEEGDYIGIATNNFAEYTAIVRALTYLKAKCFGQNLDFFLDSNLAVQQLNGVFKVKNANIRELVFKIRQLETDFAGVRYHHVPREQNTEADRMVNVALDSRL